MNLNLISWVKEFGSWKLQLNVILNNGKNILFKGDQSQIINKRWPSFEECALIFVCGHLSAPGGKVLASRYR